jgi:FtsP/CotA-like multicopper oxidase with cupredoxin domain
MQRRTLNRRSFIAAGAAGGAGLLLGLRPRGWLARSLAAGPRFERRLRIPRVLSAAEIEIPIRPAKVRVLPGRRTRMWTYGGSFPGPTIRRPAGEATSVTFRHELPSAAGELTVHLHGGHNPSDDDGQPGGLTALQPSSAYCDLSPAPDPVRAGNDLLIAPGGERTYEYPLVEDGEPERAAFQWYHDHRLDRTARNLWRGLAGMWIIDDELDASLPLPRGKRDIPLMISDRSFDADNQLTDPFAGAPEPPRDATKGERVLVNGVHRPFHEVSATRHRVRVLNASHFRSYNLKLGSGRAMTQIATESGLMPAPANRRRVRLGPGERAELILDFSKLAGREIELRSVARAGAEGPGSRTYDGPLLQFRVGERRPDSSSVPAALRPLPAWVADAPAAPQRTWTFSLGGSAPRTWLVNGLTFDPERSDAHPELGSTETWELRNATGVAHLIHLHHSDWYMLSRNGQPPKPWEACLKETFFLEPHDVVVVAGHFSDHLGKFVIHCHMLDHEDHGMMAQFEVVEPGS